METWQIIRSFYPFVMSECNLECLGFLAAAAVNKVNDDEYGVPGRVGGEVGGHQVRDERKESLCASGKSHRLFSFTR